MIKAKRKPLTKLKQSIQAYDNVLIVGCGGCVSVCLAGGQKEVNILKAELDAELKLDGLSKNFEGHTLERQCNVRFLDELADTAPSYDCIMSMACGAGVQYLAERFPEIPVLPAVNTIAIGIDLDVGLYQEKCRACGECVLAYTAGICPVTGCAKSLFNGPCGGTNKGDCELGNNIPCAWYEIYNRLEKQGRLDNILNIRPPMQWQNQVRRTIVQEPYAHRYEPA
ncbi:zinc-finger protein [Candidatus Magnetomorum sp. HK-1]|nr:zinc-finger protein [Candidatus Magnetomorum sp. HK-1]